MVLYSASPPAQTVPVHATGISVSIVAANLPANVAISHFNMTYNSLLLRATGATCGDALPGTVAVVMTSTPGIVDIGCSKLPAGTIYNSGTQTVATVTFDGRGVTGTSGQTLPTVELLDASQACIEGHNGSKCTAPGSPNAAGSITLGAPTSVGGIAVEPDLAQLPAARGDSASWVYKRVAAGTTAVVLLLGALLIWRLLLRHRA